MPKLQHSIEITLPRFAKARDMREFLKGVPDGAELEVTVYRGDSSDPREAGRVEVTIKATWFAEPETKK